MVLPTVATTSSVDGAARPLSVAVSGSAPRSTERRARRSSSRSVTSDSTASAAAAKSAPASSTTGTSSRNTPSRSRSSSSALTPVGPTSQNQRADTLRQRRQHRTVSVGHRNLPWRGKRLDDLPAGLHVAQCVGTPDERPPTRQRGLRLGVEDGVERADREALIGRRVQKLLGRRAEFRGILATALGQHAGNRGTPLLAIRLRSHRLYLRTPTSPVVTPSDDCCPTDRSPG